ncbi:MAG: hypothetical protein WC989_00225 [Micavibrio sp.]
MSFEKVIGFGIDENNPKGPNRPLNQEELLFLNLMGVEPIFINLKEKLPPSKEPEKKLLIKNVEDLSLARTLIQNARNAAMIPGQNYEENNILTSALSDEVRTLPDGTRFPVATLDTKHHSMRYRYEMTPHSPSRTQGDFNEKSAMAASNVIGGCIDRDEREREQLPGETMREAYDFFIQQCIDENNPAASTGIPYDNHTASCGYQCARNELGVAFKHPKDDVMFVFEVCEDFWHSMTPDMTAPIKKYIEWEFEVKQVIGDVPENILNNQDAFKLYVYSAMNMFCDYMAANLPSAKVNQLSKAEITKKDIEDYLGFKTISLDKIGLTDAFNQVAPIGYKGEITAHQYCLLNGDTLENTINKNRVQIHASGLDLYEQRCAYSKTAPKPSWEAVGAGSAYIAHNDNMRPAPVTAMPTAGNDSVAVAAP